MQTWISGLSGQNKVKENKTTQNGLPPTQSWTSTPDRINLVKENKITKNEVLPTQRWILGLD